MRLLESSMAAANDVLFDVLYQSGGALALVAVIEAAKRGGLGLGHLLDAGLLDGLGVGVPQGRLCGLPNAGAQFFFVVRRNRKAPRLLRALLRKADDQVDDRPELAMSEHDRPEHHVLGQLVGFGFHHVHRVRSARHHHVEIRGGELLRRRIQRVPAVDVRDPRRADRTHEGNPRNGQRGRRADHGDDVGIVFEIMRQHGADDLRFVAEALGEQRPDRPVDQPRGKRLLFRGTAFALEKTAGNLSGGE